MASFRRGSDKGSHMRNLVQPPASMRCHNCDGELRFKLIEPGNPDLDMDVQIFVCANCGREHSGAVIHDQSRACPEQQATAHAPQRGG